MIRTHKNKNDDHNNLSFSLRKNLCRLHNFLFTTNYNYANPKKHYEVTEKLPDKAFNSLVGAINHFVKAIKYSVEVFNHLDKAFKHLDDAINHLDETFNRLDEAINYNLLYINTLQLIKTTFWKYNNIDNNNFQLNL